MFNHCSFCFCLFVNVWNLNFIKKKKKKSAGLPLHPVRIQAPRTDHTEEGKQWLERDLPALRWPRRCVSVLCAATMPLDTTMVCGLVRAARPSLRGASRVSKTSASQQSVELTFRKYNVYIYIFYIYICNIYCIWFYGCSRKLGYVNHGMEQDGIFK